MTKNMNHKLELLRDHNKELALSLKALCYTINGCCQQVHKELGPWLNEYVYQDALEVLLKEQNITYKREYYFSIPFHGQILSHKHYVDFLCNDNILVECKAIECIGAEQRQQLWNYMRLSKTNIGILCNFAPLYDQCEHYYLDTNTNQMYTF